MLLELPAGGGRGVRERLEQALRVAIQQERLSGGSVLPPSRKLAADLGVARSVVVEAYRNLATNGYLETRRGGWTRVRPYAQAEATHDEQLPSYEDQLFFGWRRPAPGKQILVLGGLPDPSLFPRREWLQQYRAALAELPDAALGYPDILGAEPLRRSLAEYLGRARGAVATPGRIIVCGGFMQGLTLVCRMLRRAGARRMVVEDPCHVWYRAAIEAAGIQPVPVPVDAHGLDPSRLAHIRADALLVAPAHSYPSGVALDGQRRRALAAWAAKSGCLIIEDDYDAELRYERSPLGALQGLLPDQVIYIGSVSKTLTPALRIGWLLAPSRLIEPLAREKHYDDMGATLLEQNALARFLETGAFARHLRRIRPIYRDRRDATIRAIDATLPGATWQGEVAGLHLYLTFSQPMDLRAVASAAFEQGVMVELGSWHWATIDDPPPSLVFGYARETAPRIRRALRVIARALEEHGGARET